MSIEGLGSTLGIREVNKEEKSGMDQKKKQRREENRKKKRGEKERNIKDGKDGPSEDVPPGCKGKIDIRI